MIFDVQKESCHKSGQRPAFIIMKKQTKTHKRNEMLRATIVLAIAAAASAFAPGPILTSSRSAARKNL